MRAFSLAELMIALVILGFGLLIVGAALPVGLTYTRDTLDKGVAEAAADDALRQIQSYVRLSSKLDDTNVTPPRRLDSLVRSRETSGPNVKTLLPTKIIIGPNRYFYDPQIKVRPLVMANVNAVLGTTFKEVADTSEDIINQWFGARSGVFPDLWETDYISGAPTLPSLFNYPVLPSTARVYPPVLADDAFLVKHFYTGTNRYKPHAMSVSEMRKTLDSRVAWTAFYRRIGYEAESDPSQYEVIVVVTQRPTSSHFFPRQNMAPSTGDAFGRPQAIVADTGTPLRGADLLAPSPWLVTFTALPPPPPLELGTNPVDRIPLSTFNPPTLAFGCSKEVGDLLPVGSVFIPAINDAHNSLAPYLSITPPPPNQRKFLAGFCPHAPTTLPIYEVVERPDANTVVVKNNGYYPWVAAPGQAKDWSVWVVPPAFKERDSRSPNQPIYEKRSSILTVARRYVNFHEMP